MMQWQLWAPGQPEKQVDITEPLLAQWERKTHPAQIKLQQYLSDLASDFGPVLAGRSGLFLHMDIDVHQPERLLHHYDLENYLTPVAQRLGHAHFSLVSARKYVGGGSRVSVGVAKPSPLTPQGADWQHFSYLGWSGKDARVDRDALRLRLADAVKQPLPDGQVEVHLAWRCRQSKRNWVNLWKRTGDTMGPILGGPTDRNPFNPYDDRVVALWLHLNPDDTIGFAVDVGMWWRLAPTPSYPSA